MRRLAVGVAVGAVVLAGCASEPEATGTTLPPVTSTPSPTAAEAPELPPETEGVDADAATAFARYYLETVVNDAYRTGDVSAMAALSDAGCEGCNNLIGQIRGYKERQQLLEGGDLVVLEAAAPADEPGDTVVDMLVRQESARLIAADGSVVDEVPATEPGIAQLRAVSAAGSWKAFGFRFIEEAEP